jgi:acetate---CoA ligase (ADP-forming)
MDLNNFFKPKRIAVVGASRNPNKVGHVIFKNILDGGFSGDVIPVNTKTHNIFNRISYSSVLKIHGKVDLAVIAVPAEFVLGVVRECNKKKIKDVLIVTAGFSEIGEKKLEDELRVFLNKKRMRCIGVNCLGIFDAYNSLDTLFLPSYRMERPEEGSISFVCQSGAVGSAILDLAADQGYGFSKFISYGNATQVDESDLIEYLGNDENTKVICLYVEGVKDGEKFYKTIKKVSAKKPIIALKGGLTDEGMKATLSHTGSLAGKKEVYFGVFKQANVIRAESLEEMFHIASLIEKESYFHDGRILVITNGGGYGILSTDNIVDSKNLKMAVLSKETSKNLRHAFPKTVNIGNPLDLVGDATTGRYEIALNECIKDENIGGFLIIVLYQTPLITTDIVNVISEIRDNTDKPIAVVSTGGEFTEILSERLEEMGVPVFGFPSEAVKAIDKVAGYYGKK